PIEGPAAGTVAGMCGRYVEISSPALLAERFHVTEVRPEQLETNYNVAPRAQVPVIAERHGERGLDVVRWGLVPFWANDTTIHDRMPVVQPESKWDTWLDGDNHDVAALRKLLVPFPAGELEAWAVSTLVNKADNNGPELLEREPVSADAGKSS